MNFFKNESFNILVSKEEQKKEITSGKQKVEYSEELLNQKQKKDNDFSYMKEKLFKLVKLFIDDNKRLTNEQKDQQLEKFSKALELAMDIHSDQKPRPDGPYVNHILRVSTRIIEEYGIKDLELVVAALLHDSVEDQSEKLSNLASNNNENISKREKALSFINDKFGERVKNTVYKLTNVEHEDKNIPKDQKNKVYLEHVKEAIEDPDVLPIKLADFSDNALNLEAVKDVKKRLKLSYKYLPVIEVFIRRLEKPQNIFSLEKNTEIKNNLLFALENTKNFVDNQEKNEEIFGYLKSFLELKDGDAEKIESLKAKDLPENYQKQLEFINDKRLDNVNIVVIPDNLWIKGKQPSESDAENNIILIKQSYFKSGEKTDEIAWMTHELGHCQVFLDSKNSEDYQKKMEEFAFTDIETEYSYPNNLVEKVAFTKQFQFLKEQGKSRESIIGMIKKYYQEEDMAFFDKVLNSVF